MPLQRSYRSRVVILISTMLLTVTVITVCHCDCVMFLVLLLIFALALKAHHGYHCLHQYRSVPLKHPPILYTTSSPKWGGGVFLNTRLYTPSKKFATLMTLPIKVHTHSYKVLFVVIMRDLPTSARRAATSTRRP